MTRIVVTYGVDKKQREMFEALLPSESLRFIEDCSGAKQKESMLQDSDVLISWNPTKELEGKDPGSLKNVKFVQLISAGYDHLKFGMFPASCKIAANQGAYALPMAEHVLAMILASAKRLRRYHALLSGGHFEQWSSYTKQITGSTLGVIGFGSIGKETARLMSPFDVKVLALNTSGMTDQHVDFCGTLNDLDRVLALSDFIVLSIPLTRDTEGLIGKPELEKMKEDSVLVNVARGPIIREKDLYEHLKAHPDFTACIDAWWIEPFKFGKFMINYPFFELPNIIGSPHNSALVDGIMLEGARRAAENAARYLAGEGVSGLIQRPKDIKS